MKAVIDWSKTRREGESYQDERLLGPYRSHIADLKARAIDREAEIKVLRESFRKEMADMDRHQIRVDAEMSRTTAEMSRTTAELAQVKRELAEVKKELAEVQKKQAGGS